MDFKDFIKRQPTVRIYGVELVTLIYIAITTAMTLYWWNSIADRWGLLLTRAIIICGMIIANILYRWRPCLLTTTLRTVPFLFCLIAWYPETYDFASNLSYLDHVFAGIDHALFGCQPALLFKEAVPSVFWCEAFNLGYYSYYYMMIGTILYYLLANHRQYDRISTVFLASFFTFYLIYEFLPVAGPQYYFKAVGTACAETGRFPDVGYYFRTHLETLPVEIKGIFSQLVLAAQEVGERPTAAFPSSHVGMSTVSMILAMRSGSKWGWLFWVQLPLYILLCLATVYIQAHYAIDSICGFFAAVLFYVAWDKIYLKIKGNI